MAWKTETPPLDKVFISDIDLPWPVVMVWNGAICKFAYANVQAGLYHGQYNDMYFESEYCEPQDIKKWQDMPEV